MLPGEWKQDTVTAALLQLFMDVTTASCRVRFFFLRSVLLKASLPFFNATVMFS